MMEAISGLMLPMIAGSLPDQGPSFEQFLADLKAEAERGSSVSYRLEMVENARIAVRSRQ